MSSMRTQWRLTSYGLGTGKPFSNRTFMNANSFIAARRDRYSHDALWRCRR